MTETRDYRGESRDRKVLRTTDLQVCWTGGPGILGWRPRGSADCCAALACLAVLCQTPFSLLRPRSPGWGGLFCWRWCLLLVSPVWGHSRDQLETLILLIICKLLSVIHGVYICLTVPANDIITGELSEEKDLARHLQDSLFAAEVVWEAALCNLHQPAITSDAVPTLCSHHFNSCPCFTSLFIQQNTFLLCTF